MLNVAIPSMMSSLSPDLDRIQWVQTGYQIVQAVLIPAVGWLGTRLGTKRLFLLSTLFFAPGSALCGLAWDVHTLIHAQRQALYPLGTEVATNAVRGVLMQDGERGGKPALPAKVGKTE